MWNHGYFLKFFRFLVNSIVVSSQSIDSIAEWQQPTYWQALTVASQSRSKWGHPVGIRAAATWNLCPALEIPTGVKDVTCSGATCMQICEDGKAAMGRRRVKCRWKKKKGFFWKKVSSWNDIRLHQTNSGLLICVGIKSKRYIRGLYIRLYKLVLIWRHWTVTLGLGLNQIRL